MAEHKILWGIPANQPITDEKAKQIIDKAFNGMEFAENNLSPGTRLPKKFHRTNAVIRIDVFSQQQLGADKSNKAIVEIDPTVPGYNNRVDLVVTDVVTNQQQTGQEVFFYRVRTAPKKPNMF